MSFLFFRVDDFSLSPPTFFSLFFLWHRGSGRLVFLTCSPILSFGDAAALIHPFFFLIFLDRTCSVTEN